MTAHDPAWCSLDPCAACADLNAAYYDLRRVEDALQLELGDRAWFPLVMDLELTAWAWSRA